MIENDEEPGFRPIGELLPRSVISRPSSISTRMPSSANTGITGSPSPAAKASSSVGRQPGATGAEPRPSAAGEYVRPAANRAPSTPSMPRSTPLESGRQPNERLVSEQISRLLGHYWTADDHPAARTAQAEDWMEDFGSFPAEWVREACKQWRRTERRRPTPADIRELVLAEQELDRREADRERERSFRNMNEEGIRARCAQLYRTCPERYAEVRFVCFDGCDRGDG